MIFRLICKICWTIHIIFSDSFYFQIHNYAFCNVLFRVHVSHPYVAVENMCVRIIRNFILLFVAFHTFSMSISIFACHCQSQFDHFCTDSIDLQTNLFSSKLTKGESEFSGPLLVKNAVDNLHNEDSLYISGE